MKKLSQTNILFLIENLCHLFSAGIPLITSLEVILKSISTKTALYEPLTNIITDIKQGYPLSSCLRKLPAFDSMLCEMIRIGEETGNLEKILKILMIKIQKQILLKKQIQKILFYPLITLSVAFIVTTILMIFVIPQFESLFSDFGGQLPNLTKWIITISHQCKHNFLDVLSIIAEFVFFTFLLNQSPKKIKTHFDLFKLKIPFFKNFLKNTFYTMLARNMSLALQSGLTLSQALELNFQTNANLIFQQTIKNIRENIHQGLTLKTSFEKTQQFTPVFLQWIQIGEENGRLDEMLEKSANYYTEKQEHITLNMTQWIEPFLIIILGIIIGTLIIAMYLPIFKLGTNF